jgi:hypothetical protein
VKEQKKKILLIMLLVIVSVTAYVLVIRPKAYGYVGGKVNFKVIHTYGYNPINKVSVTELNDNIIRCSQNGVSMLDINGTTLWDKPYNMTNPQSIKVNKYLAIADIGGRDVYLFNKDGFVRSYKVDYPILMYDINENGIVAIIGQNEKGHVIQLFDIDGNELIYRETFLQNDGFPLGFDISNDGNKMVTSYLFAKGDEVTTNLTFFNFSEKGQQFDERVTGGFSIDGTIIPEIKFLDNGYVSAVGDNKILFYKIDITPEEVNNIQISNEINKVDYINKKILIIAGRPLQNEGAYKQNSLIIYSHTGEVINESEFSNDIKYLIGSGQKYYVESETFIREYFNNKINWETTLKEDVKDIKSLGNNKYLIVLQKEYKIVELVK